MQATKHDLCAGKATLDLKALKQTAESATWQNRQNLGEELRRLEEELRKSARGQKLSPMLYIIAESIKRYASQLQVNAETLYTLDHVLEREQIEVLK